LHLIATGHKVRLQSLESQQSGGGHSAKRKTYIPLYVLYGSKNFAWFGLNFIVCVGVSFVLHLIATGDKVRLQSLEPQQSGGGHSAKRKTYIPLYVLYGSKNFASVSFKLWALSFRLSPRSSFAVDAQYFPNTSNPNIQYFSHTYLPIFLFILSEQKIFKPCKHNADQF
jgi:hypothetical protein